MKMKRKHVLWSAAGLVLCLSALFVLTGRKVTADQSENSAVQPAAVVLVEKKPLVNAITLSGEFRPFQEVDVHAKVAGYIRKIYVDVGDRVKAGQTLAVLEVPELNAQLQGAEAAVRRAKDAIRRAKGDLDRTQSLYAATHLDYTRLKEASATRPGLIAAQELDDEQAKDKEGEAQIASDEAALSEAHNQLDVAVAAQRELSAMSDYTRILAPFNGVITRRNVDNGALVQSGTSSSTQALPVVSVAETDLFRLSLPVPESAVPLVRLGAIVNVHVSALNRNYEGRISRFAHALDEDTRTMHTEVDVPNPGDKIVAGMFADIILTLVKKNSALTVPIQAVTRNGPDASVLVVDPRGRVGERKVKLGIEGANDIEVLSGLSPKEQVVIGSRAEFHPGDVVVPKLVAETHEDKF